MRDFDRGRYNGADTPEEMERDQRRRDSCREMGIAPLEYESEAYAPPLTDELRRDLSALAKHEIGDTEVQRRLFDLICRFRSVSNAYMEYAYRAYRPEDEPR